MVKKKVIRPGEVYNEEDEDNDESFTLDDIEADDSSESVSLVNESDDDKERDFLENAASETESDKGHQQEPPKRKSILKKRAASPIVAPMYTLKERKTGRTGEKKKYAVRSYPKYLQKGGYSNCKYNFNKSLLCGSALKSGREAKKKEIEVIEISSSDENTKAVKRGRPKIIREEVVKTKRVPRELLSTSQRKREKGVFNSFDVYVDISSKNRSLRSTDRGISRVNKYPCMKGGKFSHRVRTRY